MVFGLKSCYLKATLLVKPKQEAFKPRPDPMFSVVAAPHSERNKHRLK